MYLTFNNLIVNAAKEKKILLQKFIKSEIYETIVYCKFEVVLIYDKIK